MVVLKIFMALAGLIAIFSVALMLFCLAYDMLCSVIDDIKERKKQK